MVWWVAKRCESQAVVFTVPRFQSIKHLGEIWDQHVSRCPVWKWHCVENKQKAWCWWGCAETSKYNPETRVWVMDLLGWGLHSGFKYYETGCYDSENLHSDKHFILHHHDCEHYKVIYQERALDLPSQCVARWHCVAVKVEAIPQSFRPTLHPVASKYWSHWNEWEGSLFPHRANVLLKTACIDTVWVKQEPCRWVWC